MGGDERDAQAGCTEAGRERGRRRPEGGPVRPGAGKPLIGVREA